MIEQIERFKARTACAPTTPYKSHISWIWFAVKKAYWHQPIAQSSRV